MKAAAKKTSKCLAIERICMVFFSFEPSVDCKFAYSKVP
jgi:hypothetical protein